MIRLTRLRNSNPLYLNPDHIERLDQYHDTTVHLFNGDEFVVTESADRIVQLITEYRARILATASRLAQDADDHDDVRALGSVADAGTGGSVSGVAGIIERDERDRRD